MSAFDALMQSLLGGRSLGVQVGMEGRQRQHQLDVEARNRQDYRGEQDMLAKELALKRMALEQQLAQQAQVFKMQQEEYNRQRAEEDNRKRQQKYAPGSYFAKMFGG